MPPNSPSGPKGNPDALTEPPENIPDPSPSTLPLGTVVDLKFEGIVCLTQFNVWRELSFTKGTSNFFNHI